MQVQMYPENGGEGFYGKWGPAFLLYTDPSEIKELKHHVDVVKSWENTEIAKFCALGLIVLHLAFV